MLLRSALLGIVTFLVAVCAQGEGVVSFEEQGVETEEEESQFQDSPATEVATAETVTVDTSTLVSTETPSPTTKPTGVFVNALKDYATVVSTSVLRGNSNNINIRTRTGARISVKKVLILVDRILHARQELTTIARQLQKLRADLKSEKARNDPEFRSTVMQTLAYYNKLRTQILEQLKQLYAGHLKTRTTRRRTRTAARRRTRSLGRTLQRTARPRSFNEQK
jgi:hypothetical protein